jgi:hypothetical protein
MRDESIYQNNERSREHKTSNKRKTIAIPCSLLPLQDISMCIHIRCTLIPRTGADGIKYHRIINKNMSTMPPHPGQNKIARLVPLMFDE